MTPLEERIDKVRDTLSWARTALDEGYTDGVNEPLGSPEECRQIAIDRIDDALSLLSPEKFEPKFGLMVCRDGVSMTRVFDPEEEAIDAVGAALIAKEQLPNDVITIVVGRVEP